MSKENAIIWRSFMDCLPKSRTYFAVRNPHQPDLIKSIIFENQYSNYRKRSEYQDLDNEWCYQNELDEYRLDLEKNTFHAVHPTKATLENFVRAGNLIIALEDIKDDTDETRLNLLKEGYILLNDETYQHYKEYDITWYGKPRFKISNVDNDGDPDRVVINNQLYLNCNVHKIPSHIFQIEIWNKERTNKTTYGISKICLFGVISYAFRASHELSFKIFNDFADVVYYMTAEGSKYYNVLIFDDQEPDSF